MGCFLPPRLFVAFPFVAAVPGVQTLCLYPCTHESLNRTLLQIHGVKRKMFHLCFWSKHGVFPSHVPPPRASPTRLAHRSLNSKRVIAPKQNMGRIHRYSFFTCRHVLCSSAAPSFSFRGACKIQKYFVVDVECCRLCTIHRIAAVVGGDGSRSILQQFILPYSIWLHPCVLRYGVKALIGVFFRYLLLVSPSFRA